MPYQFVDFLGPQANHANLIDVAKNKGEYDGNEAKFDQAVLKDLADAVQRSVSICEQYATKVTEHHAAAKKAIDEMQALIKKKGSKLSDSDINVLETSAKFCNTAKSQLVTDSGEMFTALSEYRGGWPVEYRKVLSAAKQNLVEPFIKMRAKTIDDGKKVDTLKKRVEEYADRAADLVKLAKQSASKTSVVEGQEAKEIQEFSTAVEKLKLEFETLAQKSRNSLQQVADLDSKTKLDKTMLTMNESRLLNGQTEGKNSRGAVKSLGIKIETFKKLSAKFDGESKTLAKAALKTAETYQKTIDKDSSTLDKLETKATKNLAAIKKLK